MQSGTSLDGGLDWRVYAQSVMATPAPCGSTIQDALKRYKDRGTVLPRDRPEAFAAGKPGRKRRSNKLTARVEDEFMKPTFGESGL